VRLSLLSVRVALLAERLRVTSSALVLTVAAELERLTTPLSDVAVSEDAVTEPSMSAATVVIEALGSAVTLRLSVLAEFVLVPLTVKLLLVDVSNTLSPLRVIETLLSAALLLIVDASVETVSKPVPVDCRLRLAPLASTDTSLELSDRVVLPAVVSMVVAVVDRLMSPVAEVAVRAGLLTLPKMSAAEVDTVVLSAETLKVRAPAALVVVP
jgi:hypothetical protein